MKTLFHVLAILVWVAGGAAAVWVILRTLSAPLFLLCLLAAVIVGAPYYALYKLLCDREDMQGTLTYLDKKVRELEASIPEQRGR